jgi:hypothetical protein
MAGLKNFNPLDFSAFESDWARIAAVIIIAIALVVIGTIRPISKAWADDRKDRRKHDRLNQKLQNKIAAARKRVKRE